MAGRLIRLAAPIAAGRSGVVAFGVVDTVMVGQLAPHQLAWQALGWTLIGPITIGGIALLLGVQVLAARAIGGDEPQEAGEAWRKGLVIAGAAGLAACLLMWGLTDAFFRSVGIAPELVAPAAVVARILALSVPLHLGFIASTNFLEALQRPMPGAIIMWLANGLNAGLNLMLVPQSGAIGSATATVFSRAFLFIAIAVYITGHRELRTTLIRLKAPAQVTYRALLTIGVASAVSAVVEAGAFASLGVLSARIDALSVAAFNVATGSIVTLVYMIALGFATAAAVLVSDAIGRQAWTESRLIGWIAAFLAVCAMTLCGEAAILFAGSVAGFFTVDGATKAALVGIMSLVGLLMVPDGAQGVLDAVLRARGVNWYPTIVRMLAFVGIAPALAWWLAEQRHWGLRGVMQALVTASLASYGFLLLRLIVMRRIPKFARI